MPLRRQSTSERSVASSTQSSPSGSLGTKRRFPLLGRKKPKTSDIPPSPTIPAKFLQHRKQQKPPPPKGPSLRVRVQVKFEAPIGTEHVRDYESSDSLDASDRLCQALLARLQHCSSELITRHDPVALEPLRKPHRDVKPLRYRIHYRVEREGQTIVDKSMRSFQEFELTADDAREVVAATDRIVGLFLVRHDPRFRWPAPPEAEPVSYDSETTRPCTGRPQATSCIPRSRFVHETQTFELVPGYSIELFIRSRCLGRYPENRNASIKIDSRQPSPLTLLLGEELATRASNLIIDPMDACKRKFDKKHKSCNGLEGTGGCNHVEDGAVDIMVKVRNNLGPDYNHMSQRVQTSKVLFNDPHGRDFDEFANQVKAKLERARDMSDKSLRGMDDLVLRIRELRGKGFSVSEPLSVRLDSSVTYCRQTVEAIVERLSTGIGNVLESHRDSLATLTIHKRGHLIFDGFLDGAGGDGSIPFQKFSSPDLAKKALEFQLQERIQADITMLCKDTCSLDAMNLLPNLKVRTTGGSATPSEGRPSSEISITETLASVVSANSGHSERVISKKQAKQDLRAMPSQAVPQVIPDDLGETLPGLDMSKKYSYLADLAHDDERMSQAPSTPSLMDTDHSTSPHDSLLVTPLTVRKTTKNDHQDQSNEGLRIINHGGRIVWQEQSDVDAITSGVTEMHRYPGENDVPFVPIKNPPIEIPERRASKRLETHMPDLSNNLNSVVMAASNTSDVPHTAKDGLLASAMTPEKPLGGLLPRMPSRSAPTPPITPKTQKEEQVPKAPVTPVQGTTANQPGIDAEPKPEAVAPETPPPILRSVSKHAVKVEKALDDRWEFVEANEAQQDSVEQPQVATPAAETPERQSEAAVPQLNGSAIKATEPEAEPEPIPRQREASDESWQQKRMSAKLSILDDFPPPPAERLETPSKEEFSEQQPPKEEAPKEQSVQIEQPNGSSTRETFSDVDSAREQSNNQEQSEHTVVPEPASDLETSRYSGDSGVVLEEHLKEESARPEAVVPEPIPEITAESQPEVIQSIEHDDDLQQSPAPPIRSIFYPRSQSEPLMGLDEHAVASAPESIAGDAFPSPSLPPVAETAEEEDLEDSSMALVHRPPALSLSRPRNNTLPERRYSSALTLELNYDLLGSGSQPSSPIDAPPMSAVGYDNRYASRHRRQPSAGMVGLREQRLHEMGLRSAALMPYRWRMLRREAEEYGNRPSTSYSEQ